MTGAADVDCNAVIARIRAAAARVAEVERPTFDPPTTNDDLAAFEHALGCAVPRDVRDVREFLRHHDRITAIDVHNGVWVGGASIHARGIHRGDAPRIVRDGGAEVDVMPIGGDGGGNLFLLGIRDERVWRWDHETGVSVVIAESFVRLLDQIADDVAHWARDDRAWRFLS